MRMEFTIYRNKKIIEINIVTHGYKVIPYLKKL